MPDAIVLLVLAGLFVASACFCFWLAHDHVTHVDLEPRPQTTRITETPNQ